MRNQDRQNRQDRQSSRRDENQSSRRQGSSNAGGRSDWYDRDPMDDRSGYRDEDQGYSRRMDSGDIRGYDDHYRYDQNYHSYYGSSNYNPDRNRDFERQGPRGPRESSYDSDRYSRGQGAYGTSSSGRASWDTGLNTDQNRWNSNDDYTRSQNSESSRNDSRFNDYNRDYNRGAQQNYSSQNYGSPRSSQNYGPQNYGSSSYGSQNQGNRSQQSSSYDRDGREGGSFRNESDRTSTTNSFGTSQGSWTPSGEESRSSFYGRGPKSFKRSDERIKEEVCEMLTRHNSIDADDIDVEVKDGEVTLTGSVSERRMKHLAEDAAEHCFGVKDVVNNIRVKKSEDSDVSDRSEFGSSRDKSLSSSSSKKASATTPATSPTGKSTENPNH